MCGKLAASIVLCCSILASTIDGLEYEPPKVGGGPEIYHKLEGVK